MNNEYIKKRLEAIGYLILHTPSKEWYIFKGHTRIAHGKNLTDLYNIIIKKTTK